MSPRYQRVSIAAASCKRSTCSRRSPAQECQHLSLLCKTKEKGPRHVPKSQMNLRAAMGETPGRWAARLQGRALREQADAAAQHARRLGMLVAPQQLLHLQTQRLKELLPISVYISIPGY